MEVPLPSTPPVRLDAPAARRAMALASRTNAALYRATGGRLGGRWRLHSGFPRGLPVCLLTTRGRKTGRLRTTPLLHLRPWPDREAVAVVASQGGSARHPMWYRNLLEEPRAVLQVGSGLRLVRARTAAPGERTELWPLLVGFYPDYAAYQSWTDREIPVVLLEPAGGEAGRY
ncbi:nitroreductase family deazaflavin-dependent oxidoreductase [Nocardiopsis sp. CNT-189]